MKVTQEQIEARIKDVEYFMLGESTVMICQITLDNGYSTTGKSACVDPLEFNEAIGQEIAYNNAFDQLWPLFGFLLAEQIYRKPKVVK